MVMNGSWKCTACLLSLFSPFSPCPGDIQQRTNWDRRCTCFFWCSSAFPLLSSALQFETGLFIIRPSPLCVPYLLQFSTPQWTFLQLSTWHCMHLRALCKLFSLPGRLFSPWFHQSPTHPLAQMSLTLWIKSPLPSAFGAFLLSVLP